MTFFILDSHVRMNFIDFGHLNVFFYSDDDTQHGVQVTMVGSEIHWKYSEELD